MSVSVSVAGKVSYIKDWEAEHLMPLFNESDTENLTGNGRIILKSDSSAWVNWFTRNQPKCLSRMKMPTSKITVQF